MTIRLFIGGQLDGSWYETDELATSFTVGKLQNIGDSPYIEDVDIIHKEIETITYVREKLIGLDRQEYYVFKPADSNDCVIKSLIKGYSPQINRGK